MLNASDDREVLVSQIESMRDLIRIQSAEIAELRNVEVFLHHQIRNREIEVGMIHNSWTWKTGRFFLFPIRIVRVTFRRLVQR
jgi:hypothetical protein